MTKSLPERRGTGDAPFRTGGLSRPISGAVMTQFAQAYPLRLIAAIYLDAAFDFGTAYRNAVARRASQPKPGDTATAAVRAWRQRLEVVGAASEADDRMWDIDSADAAHWQALTSALLTEVRSHPHETQLVKAPALAICAVGSVDRWFGWLTPDSARWAMARDSAAVAAAAQRSTCDQFRQTAPNRRAVTVESGHYVFIDHRDAVVRAVREFLTSLGLY